MSIDRIIHVHSLDDRRLAPYTRLKDRDLSNEGEFFIAEGEMVVRRLLASAHVTESVLMADFHLPQLAPLVPPGAVIYAADPHVVNQIVGFKFHSGVMAVGRRQPSLTVAGLADHWADESVTLVICPNSNNTENLGVMIRIAAGFGAAAMILGEHSCDPYYRQSVRVSMGAIFKLPIIQSANLLADLQLLRQRYGVELLATVLADDAIPLSRCRRGRRMGILLGNEATGLPADLVAASDRRITIPMQLGTDSLNVAVAAGIFLYHFTQLAAD